MKKIDVFGFISRIVLLALCFLGASHTSFAQVAATYGSQGLATLSYNGVTLVDTNANPGDAFRVDTYERMLNNNPSTLDENGAAHAAVWDAVQNTIAWNYSWGSVNCHYATTASQCNMIITVNNTTSTDTINGVQIGHNIHFPNLPVGFQGYSVLTSSTEYPGVQIADYGSGLVDLCSLDVSRPVYSGLKIINNSSNIYEILFASQSYTNRFVGDPIISDPIGPNQSRTYTLSLRFASSGTDGHALAADVYQGYATVHPFQIPLRDKRPIGEINSTKAGFASATNPEAYRLRGQAIDVTNHAGLVAFRAQALGFADDSIAQLQARNAQGMIVWDIEGQKYPQSITYIGDPSMIATLSPEMEFDDGSGVKTIDAFFKKFTDLGFKVGCTLRPQHLVLGVGGDSGDGVTRGAFDGTNGTQVDYATPADAIAGINAKVQYAKNRWGASLFYIDSTVHNPDVYGNPTPQPSDRSKLDPSIFEALQAMNPDCFFLIEEHDTRNQASVAGYLDLSKSGTTGGTATDIYSTYPNALSVCYVGNISPANLNNILAGVTASVAHGDILLFHGWFDDEPNNGTVNSIYNSAYPTPVITSPGTASGFINTPFSYQIAATHNPYVYAATGLPGRLQIDKNTGLISGTPPAAGTSNVQLTATNAAHSGTLNLTITVNSGPPTTPVITSPSTAAGTINVNFSYQISATGSPTSYGASSLPSPLTVNSGTGVISGIPTATGVTAASISATNSAGTGSAALTITINPPAPVISSATTATGTTGAAFSYQITATNTPTSFGASGLPSPLTVNTGTGLISGTPTTVAVTPATITATNAGGTGSAGLTITINSPGVTPFNINAIYTTGTTYSTGGLDSFNNAYVSSELGASVTFNTTSFTFGAANAADGWSNVTVNLPSGAYPTLNMVGTSSGGITTNQTFTVNYTDSTNQQFIVPMSDWTSANAKSGEFKIVTMAHSVKNDGTLNVQNHYLSGYNLGLNGKSVQSITLPTARGVVMLGFAAGPPPPVPVITSAATATGKVGNAFSYQITASSSPTSFGATSLPAPLSVNTGTGLITGTPTTAAVTPASITATNIGGTGSATLTITINPPAPVITSPATATGMVGTAFSYQIAASNNPTNFGAANLPSPLVVDTTTGIVSGTPATAATTAATITATNAGGTGSAGLTILINPRPPVITSPPTATGTTGVAFSYQITATSNPTSFGAASLPSPLTVNTGNGQITGTPSTVGATGVTISATNAGGTGSAGLTITVNPPAPVITSPSTATGTTGVAFSYQITATNSPTSFGAANLPSPLTVDPTTGIVSGTPSIAATTAATITATNAGGTGSAGLTITINSPNPTPTLTSISPNTKTVGAPDFVMTLAGTNFVSGSQVNFGGTILTPLTWTSTTLTVQIQSGLIGTAGTINVTVTNPAPGGGASAAKPFTVTAVLLTSVTLSPNSVTGGANSTGTVTLNGPAPSGGFSVSLSSSNPAASVGASCVVSAGATNSTFTITTVAVGADTACTITGHAGAVTKTPLLTVKAPVPATLILNPTSVTGPATSTATVTLTGPAPASGQIVTLSSANTSAATVPGSVTVASGGTTATFTVTSVPVGANATSVISAGVGSVIKTATLTVKAPAALTLTFAPSTVNGSVSSTGTVTLTGPAPAGGSVVTLSSANSAIVAVPGSVTVPAGATNTTFTANTFAVSATKAISVSATAGGVVKSASLTVKAPALISVSLSPTTVQGGTATTVTVTLSSPAPIGGTAVTMSSSNTAIVPITSGTTIVVPAGATSAGLVINTNTVTSNKSVTITGMLTGASKAATLTVTP